MIANRMVIRINPGGSSTGGIWAPGTIFANEYLRETVGEVDNKVRLEIVNNFSRYLSKEMAELLKWRIEYQYRSGSWTPLSPAYKEYKKKHGLSPKIWKATGFLYDNIISYRYKNEFIVGIDPKVTYENGTKLITVATSMEYGNDRMPARPLFRPVVTYMRRHVREYWDEFVKGGGIDVI